MKNDFDYCALPEAYKYWIREYHSWSKSKCPISYKHAMLEMYYQRLYGNDLLKYIGD